MTNKTDFDAKKVVIDASPIIGLSKAGRFDLLQQIFGKVVVTKAVRDEILAGGNLPGAGEIEAAVEAGWVEIVTAEASPRFADLGAGEAATLTYASETHALVLMDEQAGRSRARLHQLDVMTVVGVRIAAKRKGFVKAIRPLFDKMRARDFHVSHKVIQDALDQVGETRETDVR